MRFPLRVASLLAIAVGPYASLFVAARSEASQSGTIVSRSHDINNAVDDWTAAQVMKVNVSVFSDIIASKSPYFLAMFTDDECDESCGHMESNFVKAAELYERRRRFRCAEKGHSLSECTYPPKVKFIHVHDTFGNILEKYKVDIIPRIVFFENGKSVLTGFFGTSKQREDALCRYVMRLVQPEIVRIHSEKDMEAFLTPENDDVRDHLIEDPVTFVLIEPESGSLRSRIEYTTTTKKYRAKRFFAHVRWGEANWNRALNVSMNILPPALVRVETNVGSTLLLNGPDEYFRENAVANAIGRNQFATLPDIGNYNFKDILNNNQGLISVIRLYDTVKEREEARIDLMDVSVQYPSYIYATMNRTQFRPFILPMVDEDTDVFAYTRSSGEFWVKEHPTMTTKEFVERLLTGKVHTQYEMGLSAFPRLIRKAIAKKPSILAGLIALASCFIAVAWYCTCGFKNVLFGSSESSLAVAEHEKME